jgi:hypothetical protein
MDSILHFSRSFQIEPSVWGNSVVHDMAREELPWDFPIFLLNFLASFASRNKAFLFISSILQSCYFRASPAFKHRICDTGDPDHQAQRRLPEISGPTIQSLLESSCCLQNSEISFFASPSRGSASSSFSSQNSETSVFASPSRAPTSIIPLLTRFGDIRFCNNGSLERQIKVASP